MDRPYFDEDRVSITVDDHQEIVSADSECESLNPNFEKFKIFTKNGMVRLDEGKNEHSTIKKIFLMGIGLLGKESDVVAIHKNLYSSLVGAARMEAFRVFSAAVAVKCGGDANVKYAWYGGSRDEVYEIISHGFSRCKEAENGVSHGIGIHLSPTNAALDSVMSAEEDENGLRHMLLCRVILGKPEVVPVGSGQFQPSSENFDSGIDNPLAPKKYIIWSAYMNSHIFPNYIISFRTPNNYCVKPKSPSMKFPMLLNVLSNFLDPSKMKLISSYYKNFRENKINRSQLIRRLRQLIGDKFPLWVGENSPTANVASSTLAAILKHIFIWHRLRRKFTANHQPPTTNLLHPHRKFTASILSSTTGIPPTTNLLYSIINHRNPPWHKTKNKIYRKNTGTARRATTRRSPDLHNRAQISLDLCTSTAEIPPDLRDPAHRSSEICASLRRFGWIFRLSADPLFFPFFVGSVAFLFDGSSKMGSLVLCLYILCFKMAADVELSTSAVGEFSHAPWGAGERDSHKMSTYMSQLFSRSKSDHILAKCFCN
ncbi:Poly [ADP-ribose] polymerase [Forsythia ovata]|uniref:Poly [ADP-ribose] polymerase n=1 Tax=Forsythia ovata TaxID=205694 RepID=A0ABD1XCS5_9LAMI